MSKSTSFKPPFVRSAYNYDMEQASNEAAWVDGGEESPTVQSEKDNTDINIIVKRFGLTGTVPANHRLPMEGDYVGVTDYHSALNAVMAADEAFLQIPAEIRARFNNDPQAFHDFVVNPENGKELVEMGLANRNPLWQDPSTRGVPRETLRSDGDGNGEGGSKRDGGGAGKAAPDSSAQGGAT